MNEREKLWTPGPWEYSKDVNVVWGDLNCSRSQPGCNLAVARMVVKHSNENIEANAQLINAAPDLVEALEKLMAVESRDRVMPIGPEWDAARAALSKAYGDTGQ